MTIYEGSRYVGRDIYLDEENDSTYIGELVIDHQETLRNDDYYLYQMKDGDRLDIIAKRIYGDEQLKWKILEANPQYLHEIEIKSGDYLKIPKYEVTGGELF